MRLWNRLVFSEGYFRRLANSSRYERKDLSNIFTDKITTPIEKAEASALEKKYEEFER